MTSSVYIVVRWTQDSVKSSTVYMSLEGYEEESVPLIRVKACM